MVRRDIEDRPDPWMECLDRLELEAGHFRHDHVPAASPDRRERGFRQGRSEVPAHKRFEAGRPEKFADQRDGRAFSIRAGHADQFARQEAGGQFNLSDDANPRCNGALHRRQRHRHTRTDERHVRRRERLLVRPVAIQPHVASLQAAQDRRQLGQGFLIGDRDARAEHHEQTDCGCAASAKTDHRHLFAVEFERMRFFHGGTPPAHLSFNVLKLNRASRMAMIHKRTTTLGSSHPFSSK